MRDMMAKVEETVESKKLEQLMKVPLWPAAVSTAAVALIPKEANQMPAPLDLKSRASVQPRFVDVIR